MHENDRRTDWDRFVESFLDSYFEAQPVFAAGSGRHEYDGRLPDWSEESLAGEAERLRAERRRVEGFDPALLDEARRFEREYLLAQIDCDLFWLVEADCPHHNPIFYAGPLDPSLYTTRPYAPLAERLEAYVRYARQVPRAAAQVRENLRRPMPRTYAELGEMTFSGLADYFEKDVPTVFAPLENEGNEGHERLVAELREANAPAIAAMRELGAWFQGRVAEADAAPAACSEGFRLGPDLFLRMLRDTERVDVSLADLETAGRRELVRNLEALREACEVYAPGTPITECLARVQADKPEGGPIEAARRQLAGLRRFVEEQDLVSIPGSEEALIEESPPYQRWNSAYIDIPGAFDRHLPSIYYIAPPDPSWSPEERAAYIPGEADLLFITAHEVWPGHFLQVLHSHRAASPVGRLFVGYGFAEGWAHYSEELMWEAGFGAGDPGIRIGQLQNALLRNVRYLVTIGLHTGDLTLDEAERMFREQAFQDAASARQQAARGTFDPAYLNYTLGKLMVRKLRCDWTATRGGRDAWRGFHDRLLSYGGPPIPLVRQAMLGEEAAGSLF
jgi:hypothetical protein